MKVVVDLDSHQAIQDFGIRAPAPVYQFKSQDTVEWELYFVQNGVVQDLGSGFALKFGMIKTGDTTNTLLAYQTAFTHLTDASGNVYYSGLVNFNTAQMATAMAYSSSIPGTAEIRYQDALNEIIHTINISTVVYATILVETGVTPPNVSTGYPDASAIELLVRKNAASGYAGLNSSSKLNGSVVPVDGQTVKIDGNGNVASAAILANVTANFTTPTSGADVSVTLDSTTNLRALSYVRIPIAGYYIVESITDSTHAVLRNNGDPFNAASGATITTGAVLLPAQAAAGGGGTGQGAYTATNANFTVPAVGSAVTISVGSTAWMGGSGYSVFISGAGYYLVNSIVDTTHAAVSNTGSSANRLPGTTVVSGATVSAAGAAGPAGANGQSLAAYDTVSGSFTMPNAGATVNIVLTNTTAWMGIGQAVYIAGAGYFSVTAIINATNATISNLNYPGNAAAASTIAAGAHIGPGGLQGAQGTGGPGLNAFTTLTSNFPQPAVGTTVTIVVGSSAWMVVGQGIFVQGGGYYNVSSIPDLTHVTVTNLGTVGNLAPGSTITGNGTQTVSPAGTPGINGGNAYTATAANFTTPAAGSSVTVTVNGTAWATTGQVVFIAGAGYYQVAAILSATQFSLTNLAGYGNTSGGATINSGASVSPSGVIGPAGPAGTQGPPGAAGSGSTIYTGSSLQGNGNVATPATLVADVAQGTNAYAAYQRDASGNSIWAPIPTDGTTITVSAGKLTVIGGGGGGGTFDPATGLYFADDFGHATADTLRYATNLNGGTVTEPGTYGQANTALKVLGCSELATGTVGSANQGIGYYWGGSVAPAAYPVLYGLGTLTWKTRIFIESTLPPTGISYFFRAGIGQMSGTFYGYANNPIQGFFFEYDPTANSGQWRVAYATTGTPTYTNTSVAVAGDTAYNLEIDANAAWTSLTFKINGATVATLSSGFPTNVYGAPVWALGRGAGSTTSYKAAIDSWMINYAFTR